MPSPAIRCSKMPTSPVIRRSKSAPNISRMPTNPVTQRPKSAPEINSMHFSSVMLSLSKPVRSSPASWTVTPGDYVKTLMRNSNLTVEDLQEFNRRNALKEGRYYSPYYRGLTNFSLVINREKQAGLSPGRESHATSSSTVSSFVVRMQEWGSCFTSRTHEKGSFLLECWWTKSHRDARSLPSSLKVTETGTSVTRIRTKARKNESESERNRVTFCSSTVEKPLGDRNPGAASLLPLSPPTSPPPESFPYPLPHLSPPVAAPQEPLQHPQLQISQSLAPPPVPIPYPLTNHILPPLESFPYQWPHIAPPTADTLVLQPSAPISIKPQIQFSDALPQPPTKVLHTSSSAHVQEPIHREAENQITYIWSDKHRPSRLQDFLCNRKTALSLQSMVRNWHDKAEEYGHFIFEGNPGVGKRTMIWALLREAFGHDKVQAREECKKVYLKGEAESSILLNLSVSPHHVEVNISQHEGYEKHILVELVKDKRLMCDTTSHCSHDKCKAIILYDAEKLSIDSLSYIKWMLEKFKGNNKVFFCCSDAKKLGAIKRLCTYVQLLDPSLEEVLEVLAKIAKEEKIELPQQLAKKIARHSKNNLRQAIRSLEATWHYNGCCSALTEDQEIKTGWEDKIADIAKKVIEEQSPKQLYNIRREIQNLLEHNADPKFIFQTLREELTRLLSEQLQPQFAHLSEEYQKNNATEKHFPNEDQDEELGKRQHDHIKIGQQFMRIEEFIARFMSWYKGLAMKHKEI